MSIPTTTLAGLLSICQARGIRLTLAESGGLSIDAPRNSLTPDVLNRLKARKAEVLAILRHTPGVDTSFPIDPTHPLATFEWDANNGYCPGQPIVRDGVRHKREDCLSRQSWQHVWGERFCSACWPSTDSFAVAVE